MDCPWGSHHLPLNCGFAWSKGAGRDKVEEEKKREGIRNRRREGEDVGWVEEKNWDLVYKKWYFS